MGVDGGSEKNNLARRGAEDAPYANGGPGQQGRKRNLETDGGLRGNLKTSDAICIHGAKAQRQTNRCIGSC